MTHQNPPEHFKGKTVSEHLKDARLKGALATKETHGTEMPGHFSAGTDGAKNTAIIYLIIWAAMLSLPFDPLLLFIVFGLGWTVWNAGRSALLGWARLERLHRIIEEERWEIEHHRDQEKEELRQMYADKGFSGELLETIVNVLMSDDNRLLGIMLEEELGLTLEAYEHPLKQAFGAAIGTFFISLILTLSFFFWPKIGIPLIGMLTIVICANLSGRYEKRRVLPSIVWNVSIALFSLAIVYFVARLL